MKPIVNETFYRFSYLSRLQASPKESRYGLVVATANKKTNEYDHALYVGETTPKEVLKLGTQAEQFHSVLLTNGVDTRFIWFKDETHELSRSGKPHARIKRLSEIQNWFARYV